MKIVKADWVLPITSDPIFDGAVVIDSEGQIIDVGNFRVLRKKYSFAEIEKYRGFILPGFINPHTHLELSGLSNKVLFHSLGLSEWLHRLNNAFEGFRVEDHRLEILAQVKKLKKNGTVAVGDISNSGLTSDILLRYNIGGTVFLEYLDGLGEEKKNLKSAMEFISEWSKDDLDKLSLSMVPHALYSTSSSTIKEILNYSQYKNKQTSIHWKESEEEIEFVDGKLGPLLTLMCRLWPALSNLSKKDIMGFEEFKNKYFNKNLLIVHCVESSRAELKFIKKRKVNLAFCPRSNMNISGRLPNISAMLELDIPFALGTDSLVSVQDLDVRNEVAFLRDMDLSIPAETLLKAITIYAARAIGKSKQYGSIEIGKKPGLIFLEFTGYTDKPIETVISFLEKSKIVMIL